MSSGRADIGSMQARNDQAPEIDFLHRPEWKFDNALYATFEAQKVNVVSVDARPQEEPVYATANN
ncbi:MAG: hypothetical protein EOQ50_19040 [Mesorhizobium sp.]|uniref:hypothetical protein n=1 Tax=Mesorhizobium sp. TaxID=1871066 RepID=UPI000FE8792C|nr:hypothetical protein [Mesorhizobium sp.]RWB72344.1 MAG: hypothetical protein EOQ50_19040 [Mesorhizobium sp.]